MKKALIIALVGLSLSLSAQLPEAGQSIDLGLTAHESAQYGSNRYKIEQQKIIGWAAIGLGSFIWYSKERWEFQGRRYFEVKYGADEYGFWGSKAHVRVRDKFFKDDFYHFANTGGKWLILGGGITLGISGAKTNKKKIHYLYDFLIAGGVSVLCSWAGDQVLRL